MATQLPLDAYLPTSNDPIEGHYANFFKVGHNSLEFILDFGQVYSDTPAQMMYHTRIVTSPAYALAWLDVLQEAIQGYQRNFGPIQKPEVFKGAEKPQ